MKLLHTPKYHFNTYLRYIFILIIALVNIVYNNLYLFKTPLYTVLINQYESQNFPNLKLYYATPNQNHICTYTLTKDSLRPVTIDTVSFTEGFLPLKAHHSALTKINTQIKPPTALTYFYNYYKDPYYEIIAPSGPLSQVYFINQVTEQVKVPDTSCLPMAHFYLNHVIRNHDVYYLLGDTINAYSSELYTLDATTLKVLQYTHFETSPFTIYKEHSSLNINGHAFFITKNGLGHIHPAQINGALIPLNFTPSYIVSNNYETIAFTFNTSHLTYALIDVNGLLINQGDIVLPHEHIHPIKALLQGPYLTLLTFNPTHPLYTNYVLIYDITNWHLIYCCALQNLSPYTALDISFIN